VLNVFICTPNEAKAISASLCIMGGLTNVEKHFSEQVLDMAHTDYRGMSIGRLLVMAARKNYYPHDSASRDLSDCLKKAFNVGRELSMSGFSTVSLPGILGNTVNKFVLEAFNAVEQTWRKITNITPVKDFKEYNHYALTGDLTFEKVGASGDIKHGTLGEQVYSNEVDTYARMLAMPRRDIINDDLGALPKIGKKIGRGGALAINKVFWTEFMNNGSFFTAPRGNFDDGGDTVFGATAVGRAETMFKTQTDPNGEPLGAEAKILLVPTQLATAGRQLVNSTTVYADNEKGGGNPYAGKFQMEESAYLQNSTYPGYSTTAWYLLGDRTDLPVMDTAFLDGKDVPTIETAEADFSNLGISIRGFWDFGCRKMEYRGGVKMAGA